MTSVHRPGFAFVDLHGDERWGKGGGEVAADHFATVRVRDG